MEYENYLHDFRDDIVERKRLKVYWGKWSEWNVLYKTIAYELSSSRDVESYLYVRDKAFKMYAPDYKKFKTADIMNGWWYCFKEVFEIKKGRKDEETRKFMEKLMGNIEGLKDDEVVDFLHKTFRKDKEVYKLLLEFLKVVYTAGNITPSESNVYRGKRDDWETELLKNGWALKEKDSLYFGMYEENVFEDDKSKDFEFNLKRYMESRIHLILKRALEIHKNTQCDLDELLNRIDIYF